MLCNVIQRYFLCCEPSVTIIILSPYPPFPAFSPFHALGNLSPYDFIFLELGKIDGDKLLLLSECCGDR